MDEMNMINDVTIDNEINEVTDMVPVAEGDSVAEGGIGAGEIVIGGLAAVGAGFIIKKTVDLTKAGINKAKAWNEARKAKKAEKADPASDGDVEIIDDDAAEVEDNSDQK